MPKAIQRWLLISLALHLVTAWFSGGFYNFDEQFQILEFLSTLQGRLEKSRLAWEYQEQMRSWLQPYLYFGLGKFLALFGVLRPIALATAIRIFNALIGWASCWALTEAVKKFWLKDSKESQVRIFFLLNFLWFIPYLHARTSGENFSSSLFALMLAAPVLVEGLGGWLLSGLAGALSFEARYQVGILIAVWGIYALRGAVSPRRSWSGIFGWGVAFIAGLAGVAILNRAGYETWTFPAWHYLRVNLIEGKLANFGSRPWWSLMEGIFSSFPPVSVGLLILTFVGAYARPKGIFTWMNGVFLAVHSKLKWKELRFLFPAAVIWPFVIDQAFVIPSVKKILLRPWIIKPFWTLNGLALLWLAVSPANSSYPFFKFMERKYSPGATLVTTSGSPYAALGLEMRFYRPDQVRVVEMGSEDEFFSRLDQQPKFAEAERWVYPVLYFDGRVTVPEGSSLKTRCERVYSNYPDWLLHYNINHWLERTRTWRVYQCR